MAEEFVEPRCRFSYYYQTLEDVAKTRYDEKLAMLGGMEDPYTTIQYCELRRERRLARLA